MWYSTRMILITYEQQKMADILTKLHLFDYNEIATFSSPITHEVECAVYEVRMQPIIANHIVKLFYNKYTFGERGQKRMEYLQFNGTLPKASHVCEFGA